MRKANIGFLEKLHVNEPLEIGQLMEFHQGIKYAVDSFKRKGFPSITWGGGDYGTLSKAFKELCSAFDKLSENIDNYGKGLTKTAEAQIEAVQTSCRDSQQLITEIFSICDKVAQYDQQFTALLTDQSKLTISVYRKVSEIGSGEPSGKDLRILRRCYEEIQSARNSTLATKAALVNNIQMMIDVYRIKTAEFSNGLTKRRSDMANTVRWSGDAFVNFGKELVQEGATLRRKAAEIDFDFDFVSMLKKNCITRLDTEYRPFEKFDTSHAAFKDFEIDLETEEDEDPLPVAFGKIVKDFAPQGENQTSCTTGSTVYMMENNCGEWCYIMDPWHGTEGFIPSSCVEAIGTGIGVVARIPNECQISVRVGDMVAITDTSQDREYKIMDICGRPYTIRKDCVAEVSCLAGSC